MVSLPPELIDRILDFLHADSKTLAQCSLASRAFLPSSRYYLFRSVTIKITQLSDFLDLFQSPCITFISSVKELFINGLNSKAVDWNQEKMESVQFPSVIALYVHSIEVVEEGMISWVHRGLPHIRSLSLESVLVRSLNNLAILARGFPCLQSLSLSDVGWEKEPTNELDISPPTSLRSLKLSHCYKGDALSWIFSPKWATAVETLDLGLVAEWDTGPIGRALKVAGSTLHKISIGIHGFNAGGSAESFLSDVDLRHNTALRSIHIYLNLSEFQLSSPLSYIPAILTQVSSEKLVNVTFNITVSRLRHFDLDPYDESDNDRLSFWTSLDQSASKPQLSNLQSMVFELQNIPLAFHTFKRAVSDRLPSFDARGILEFKLSARCESP